MENWVIEVLSISLSIDTILLILFLVNSLALYLEKIEEKAIIIEYIPENIGKLESMLKKSDIKKFTIIK